MELMTRDMGDIAYKTKTETVSMRIITLVTLFFLPGTFVSVCCLFLLYLVGAYYPVRTLGGEVLAVITTVTTLIGCAFSMSHIPASHAGM